MQKIFAIPFLGSHSCTLKWKFGAKFFQTRYLGHDKVQSLPCQCSVQFCLKNQQNQGKQPSKVIIHKSRCEHFYGTEIEIWAGFWPVGITEKKTWVDYEQLLRAVFFMFSWAKNYFSVYTRVLPVYKWPF